MSVEPIELNQRMTALATANRIRVYRAELKRNIGKVERAKGLRMVADILDTEPNDDLRTMRAMDLVGAVDRIGSVKVRKFLFGAQPDSGIVLADAVRDTTLGGMTERERAALARTLRAWAA